MILCDVNMLVYAFRRDTDRHQEFKAWVVSILEGDAEFGLAELF